MKNIIIALATIVIAVGVILAVVVFKRKENVDYIEFIDEKCNFSIGDCLEYDKGVVYSSGNNFSLQYKIKTGCEEKVDAILTSNFSSDMKETDSTIRISDRNMAQMIKTGTIIHIFSFFRNGSKQKTIEINICVAEIQNRQYLFLYTV